MAGPWNSSPGQTILEIARQAGIYTIPTLCYMKHTKPTGSCRICVVEVEGWRTLAPACATAAAPGMVITTESARIDAGQKNDHRADVRLGQPQLPGL